MNLRLVFQLVRILPDVEALANLPDIDDKAACRAWLLQACDVADKLADLTENSVDDATVATVRGIVTSDAAWDGLYAIVHALVCRESHVVSSADVESLMPPCAAGEVAAVDPATILAIVQAIATLWQWWRNRQ